MDTFVIVSHNYGESRQSQRVNHLRGIRIGATRQKGQLSRVNQIQLVFLGPLGISPELFHLYRTGIQEYLDGTHGHDEKPNIQATWGAKDDLSPFSTHVHQLDSRLYYGSGGREIEPHRNQRFLAGQCRGADRSSLGLYQSALAVVWSSMPIWETTRRTSNRIVYIPPSTAGFMTSFHNHEPSEQQLDLSGI
jgi:hypothetical protein